MDARVSLLTLGVADLERSVKFYREGLGWKMSSASVGDVAFFQMAGGLVLALYPRWLLAADASVKDESGGGFGGITIAHNVRTREEVDATLAAVRQIGARILKPAEDAVWGGRSGYFADPDGHPWEVAWNPHFAIADDGGIRLP